MSDAPTPLQPQFLTEADAASFPTGRKTPQILDAAQFVFFEQGFAGASVDEIVQRAGVSKATLYKYFNDKEMLFSAVIERVSLQQRRHLSEQIMHLPVAEALIETCRLTVKFMASPLAQDMFRVCVGESGRFPHVANTFYESVIVTTSSQFSALFARGENESVLTVANKPVAARQLWDLCRSTFFYEMMFGLRKTLTRYEQHLVVQQALMLFVCHHGTKAFNEEMKAKLDALVNELPAS